MPRSRIRRGRKTTKRRPFGRFRGRRNRRAPTRKTLGIGKGLLRDKPMDLVINKGLGFPGRFRTKVRYSESISITNTAGVINYYVFAANGLYDPNITGTGHQPMYFDQWMTVYDHYKVLGAKIHVRPTVTGTTLINPVFTAVILNDDYSVQTAPSAFGAIVEEGLLNDYQIVGGAYSNNIHPMICKYSTVRLYKDKYQSDQLSGDAANNPAETAGFIIVQQPMDGASTVTVQYEVIIDYVVDFYELRDIAQS